jgi:hypothetical protein
MDLLEKISNEIEITMALLKKCFEMGILGFFGLFILIFEKHT